MEVTHDGRHGPECFGCKVKTVSFDPYAMPTRLNKKAAPKQPEPRWERGVPTDNRGMPFLDKNLNPLGVKQYAESRSSIEAHRRQLKNSTS